MLEYADDRPWPGSTGWSDAASRSALDVIAAGAEHMCGFAACCIRIVHRGTLRAVAVGGTDEQRELLMDSHTPVDVVEAELDQGDSWGRFRFVPAGRVPDAHDWGSTLDVVPLEGPDAWRPEDVLAAPVRDAAGRMVGMLSLDLPVSGRRPDAETRAQLEQYAELVEGAVLMALDHHEQQERLTMARAARDVVTAATRELSMTAVFAESAHALMAGFSARGVWLQTFELGESHGAVHAESGTAPQPVPAELVVIAERLAHQAWADQEVGALSRVDQPRQFAGAAFAQEREAVLAHLDAIGIGSILFVPIGVGVECLGCLVLTRESATQRWTEAETDAARDIGMDLGRAILNARAYEREQRAVQELQALDGYKSQLVATLSHELKTPLTSILGNLEMLEDDVASPADRRRGISAIGRGATRLVNVVEDLMLLAKVGDPGNHLITRPVDLADLAGDVVDLTSTLARRRGLAVVLDVQPAVTMGDATELDRVLGNLLTNAIKYTPEGGRVTLRVEQRGDEAVVTCTDTGIGIGASDLPRLFGEFFRSADPSAQRQPGTGLGLAIVDGIVRRHGGRVEVESTLGVGSTFRVVLPAAAAPAPPTPVGARG